MPEYKRQHYIPVAYLKYFSTDQGDCNRESWIWRLDGETQKHVSVVSQCAGDYHFTRTRAADTERMFGRSEARYCRCVDKIRAGQDLTQLEFGDLLLRSFEFNLRSNVHLNRTGKEGIDAFYVRNGLFIGEILGTKGLITTPEQLVKHLEQYWDIRVLITPPGHILLTSDHPAVWISLQKIKPALHLTLLPIAPSHIAVAFDKRVVTVRDVLMTENDEAMLNLAQMENAVKSIYSSQALPDETVVTVGMSTPDSMQRVANKCLRS